MMVKICGITNSDDALAAVDAGATALGFVFFGGSARFIGPDRAAEIVEGLPPSVTKVGVYVNSDAEWIQDSARAIGLDVVQLHGECGMPAGFRVWKSVRIGPDFRPETIAKDTEEAMVLDTASAGAYGGTGESFDWALARNVRHRVILAGGLSPENVAQAIRTARPWGVDASSKLELRPGIKHHRLVREFVRAALEAASVSQ